MSETEANTIQGNAKLSLQEKMEKCGHFLHFRRGGKRSQGRILRILYREGSISQRKLQERLEIQSGSMSEIILKLEKNGLLVRTKSTEDKRSIILQITEAGKDSVEEEYRKLQQQDAILFESLSGQEQEQLDAILGKLLESWESQFDKELFEHRKGGTRA